MKKVFTLILFSIIISATYAQKYHYLSTFNNAGVPSQMTYESVSNSLLDNIAASLPESYPVPTYNPQYITDSIDVDVQLQELSDVWVTFVKEGAGYQNVLGFYTYTGAPSANPPSDVTIIFPNFSASGSGGGLNTGATVHLGTFPAGTNIGWYLIANGFSNGNVGNGIWKFYSNPNYNPENVATKRHHNVSLYDTDNQIVVIGFEDIARTSTSCDQDFNDAIFYVKTNPVTAMKVSGFNNITQAGEAGSGAGGGLESKLASKVATRLFLRQFNNEKQLDKAEKQALFIANEEERGENLSNYIPQNVFLNSIVKVSTPKDLVEITNAKDVLAVDYYNQTEDKRLAAILATETFGKVYEHTKVICDRLIGAQLSEIRSVNIEGKTFTINKLIQPGGNIEYALSFSAYEENNELFIETQWGVDQYPIKSKFYNFQIWGNSPSTVQRLAIEVIAKLRKQYTVKMATTTIAIPKVFVKNGRYHNGILYLDIQNPINAKKITVSGRLQRTETSLQDEAWSYTFDLKGSTETIQIPLGKVFDTGILIANNKSVETDFMYLSDGVWSYGVNPNEGTIQKFEVSNDAVLAQEDPSIYRVERNVNIKGKVKKQVAIFRTLRPSGKTIDLRQYRQITFDASGKGSFEIVLVKKSIEDWDKQFRMQLQLDGKTQTFHLSLEDFRSIASTQFITNDISSVVIVAKGNQKTEVEFELNVENIKFSKFEGAEKVQANIYPNPATDNANLEMQLSAASTVDIKIFDSVGKLVTNFQEIGTEGFNRFNLDLSSLNNGLYLCHIKSKNEETSLKLIVQGKN